MSFEYYENLILDVPNGNTVYVIGTKPYVETGISMNYILQYNGTSWVPVSPGSVGSGEYGIAGTGTLTYLNSKNYLGPAQNVGTNTTIATISTLPNTTSASGYRLDV